MKKLQTFVDIMKQFWDPLSGQYLLEFTLQLIGAHFWVPRALLLIWYMSEILFQCDVETHKNFKSVLNISTN